MNIATHYLFRASNGDSVIVRRGFDAPKMTGGGGGWDLIERPRRVSVSQWKGHEPYKMDVSVLFDGLRTDDSVEMAISRLNQMQMSPSDLTPPPTVKIFGAVPIKGATWTIEVEWGDNIIYDADNNNGFRVRQDAVVHMTQFIHEDRLKVAALKIIPAGTHVIKKGETLRKIAKLWYGDANKAPMIRQANPWVRDPNKLPRGKRLRIPADMNPTGHATRVKSHPKPKPK